MIETDRLTIEPPEELPPRLEDAWRTWLAGTDLDKLADRAEHTQRRIDAAPHMGPDAYAAFRDRLVSRGYVVPDGAALHMAEAGDGTIFNHPRDGTTVAGVKLERTAVEVGSVWSLHRDLGPPPGDDSDIHQLMAARWPSWGLWVVWHIEHEVDSIEVANDGYDVDHHTGIVITHRVARVRLA